jgi:uncharacterized membrane protein YcaP (DUF421 family)
MLNLAIPAWDIVLRTAAIYAAILIGLRLAGKREMGQLTVFDLVVLLLIANAVQNAMVGPDTSLLGGVLAAGVLLILNALLARLRLRWPWLRRAIEGSPTVLVFRGRVLEDEMKREEVDPEMLRAALRGHGMVDEKGVYLAVLEIDGSISVVPDSAGTHYVRHPVKFFKRQ